VIRRDEAMDLLIEAAPSFWSADDLHAFPQTFEEHGEPDLYVRVAAFTLHVVRLLDDGSIEEPARVFEVVEAIFADGDPEAVELMQIGLLEDLQNIVSHSDVAIRAEDVAPLLGPASRSAWNRLADLWTASEVHVRDGGPTEDEYLLVDDPNLKLYFRTKTRALPDGRLMSASQVLRHESELLDALRHRQHQALRRFTVFVFVACLLLALVALVR
jgi:hypothetical protein